VKPRLSHKERRRFKRASLSVELFYKVIHVPEGSAPIAEKENTTYLINIGEGGLAFVSGSQLSAGVDLEVIFNFVLAGRRDLKITAVGQVCYCILMGDYRRYQVGIEFTKIDEVDRKFISDFVAFTLGDKKAG